MLNVQGQVRAVAHLQRALRAERLASTWIFAGPPGVGKFTTALALAKTKLCDKPVSKRNNGQVALLEDGFELTLPCNVCESCRAVDAGSHPDVHVVTRQLIRYHDETGKSKGTTLSIAVIRGEITGDPKEGKEAKIYKRSFRGKGKFFIIDQADLMDVPAQNALLKTLEEPPAESYLVLVTSSPQELLSTIRSRSQVVLFSELPDEMLLPALIGKGLSHEDAKLMARLARGSLGRAMAWADDLRIINEKNERAEKRRSEDDDDDTPAMTPGGPLAWARDLGGALDELVAGRASASDVAAVLSKYAGEYARLQVARDKLTSVDRAKRDGVQLLLGFAAEWFSDRLRLGLGTPHETTLPARTAALDHGIVPQLIMAAQRAEATVDMNANEKILLAAITTQWEDLLLAR